MQFQKGQSENPTGRKVGSKNSLTLMREVLLEGEPEAIMRRAIDGGLKGEEVPLRLCLDRIWPRLRPREEPVEFELPPINSVHDLLPALSAIAAGVASGELTPEQGGHLSLLVHRWTEAVQVVDFDARLKKIEEAMARQQAAPGT